jgi:hypothetical protein
MASRRHLAIVFVGVFLSTGATYRTTNFVVTAPTPQIAESVGRWAEHYRREKALLWLGYEMPNWSQPCPLQVQIDMRGPGGSTSFNFGPGGVASQFMEIKGPLDRLIASVLPHEVTHTVFAHHFRQAVPRWADEGGAVLSEDDVERGRHDSIVRNILNHGQQFRLRQLFNIKQYPPSGEKVMCLYAQGYSVSDYLVKRGGRPTFLRFVGMGMQGQWDQAAQACYGHRTVEELEESWLKHLRDTKNQPAVQFAQNTKKGTPAEPTGRVVVRLTAPPAQPLEPAPVVRGQAPTQEQVGQTFGKAAPQAASPQVPVTLGPPQFGSAPTSGPSIPRAVSPVGFPQ